MKGLGVTAEQRSLLSKNNHSLRPLATSGHLNVWQAFQLALLPTFIFAFTLLCLTSTPRLTNQALVHGICGVVLTLLLAAPVISFTVIVIGIAKTKMMSTVQWNAVLYWAWWPFWRCAMCVGALSLGLIFANNLWFNYLLPYQQMMKLQTYNNINPALASGVRLQDIGMASFNSSANVDRARTGCLKNSATYCVAPIVDASEYNAAAPGMHDLFMAGTDCCDCPGEFRCGDWDVPMAALGGMRVVNEAETSFYRLAAENWAATFGASVRHPIFFTWVRDPIVYWRDLRARGVRLLFVALLSAPFALIVLAVILNGVLRVLQDMGLADYVEGTAMAASAGKQIV